MPRDPPTSDMRRSTSAAPSLECPGPGGKSGPAKLLQGQSWLATTPNIHLNQLPSTHL